MKPTTRFRSFLIASSALLCFSQAHAAKLYWIGSSGTWDLSNTNWATATSGPWSTQWLNVNNDTAVFSGTAGTVTLGNNITVGGLQFNTTGYGITTGANTLSFGATNNFIGFSGVSAATITGAVGGSGNVSLGLVKPLVGTTLTPFTLNLNGTSTGGWSGTTTIGALSTLSLSQSNQALASTTGGITLNGGGITLVNIDSTEGALSRVNNSAITANGGTFTYTNTSGNSLVYAETIGSVALTSGQTNFVLTNNMAGTSNTQTLTLSGLTRTGSSNTSTVTFSGNSLNAITNIINNTGFGGTATPANQIIGPWATTGTAAGTQTKWAVYDSSGNIVPDSIGDTANDTTWTTAANAYSLNTGSALTINTTRTITALRFYGGASTLTLGTGNLETYGLAFTGGNAKTVASTGGALTTPTGGGALYITTANAGTNTISAPINNNGGAVSVVKSGGGGLTLSGTNGFTGSVVLNGGTLTAATDANLGATGVGAAPIIVNGSSTFAASSVTYARGITLNNGAILSIDNGNNPTFSGNVTGSGGIRIGVSGFGNQVTFSGTANTFEGPILIAGTGTGGQAYRLQVSSFADSATANGRIVFASNSVSHGDGSVFQYNGSSDLTLDNRVIEIASSGATPTNGHQVRSSGTGLLTINTDLLVTSTTAQNLRLGGTNTGNNRFDGDITNGSSSAVSLTKADAGKWILSGTNTYTGLTINGFSNPAGAGLVFEGMQALSPSTTLQQTHAGGVGGFGSISLLDNSATPASRSGVNINMIASNGSHTMTLYVDRVSGANTGSTIQLGKLNFTQTVAGNTSQTLAVTGANDYKLQISGVDLPALVASSTTWNGILDSTTAPLKVAGNVQQKSGSLAGTMTLTLSGSNAGSSITGNVLDSADGTPRALNVTKTGTGNWALDGTANAFTGTILFNTTTSSAGTLSYASAAGNNPITFAQTTGSATLKYTGASALTMSGLISATALTTGVITLDASGVTAADTINYSNTSSLSTAAAGASGNYRSIIFTGSNTGENTFAGAIAPNTTSGAGGLVRKDGTGKWVLTGLSTYNGTTDIRNGTLSVNSIKNSTVASAMGAGSSFILGNGNDSGTLLYTGAGDSSNRVLQLGSSSATPGTGGGSILNDGSGALTFTATNFNNTQTSITDTRTLTLGGSYTGAVNEIQGVIRDNTASTGLVNLAKTGNSTWALSGANTYTGTTTISGGTLQIGAGGTTGSLATTSAITNNATLAFNRSDTVTQGTHFANTIGGSGGVTQAGSGTLVLGGTNTYAGATNVTAGTLIINGSTSSTSLVTVNSGTTLGGSGTVGGATTIYGTHSPGNSPGIQTFGSNLTYDGGSSVVNWELIDNTSTNAANPNAIFDQIIVGGDLDFADATTINLSFIATGSNVLWSDTFWDTNQSWTLYDVTGTTTNLGNLSLVTINWLDSGSNLFNTVRSGNNFTLTQSGNDVMLNYIVVPEPRAALLGGLGMLMLLRRRRTD